MNDLQFVEKIKCLCTGAKMPDSALISAGKFPEGWVRNYLKLLLDNRIYWQNLDKWPRELSYCFYRVGFHIGYSYSEWLRSSKETNTDTERDLAKIRMFTDAFIAGDPSQKWVIDDE